MGNYIFAVNKNFPQRLKPEQQQAVRKAARAAAEWNRNELKRELDRTISGSKDLSVELVKPTAAAFDHMTTASHHFPSRMN